MIFNITDYVEEYENQYVGLHTNKPVSSVRSTVFKSPSTNEVDGGNKVKTDR
jgi:hypothetical protein